MSRVSLATAGFLISLIAILNTQRTSAAGPTAVDLSRYVRVGRFDLPEPSRTGAPPNSLLAQEASGVTYNWDSQTLFVVGDGGTSVVEVTKTGQFVSSMTLAQGSSPQGTEFYDTEGITYVGDGKFVFVEERYRQVNLFTYVAGGTLRRSDVQTAKLGTTIGNVGFEGISFDPQTGGFIIVKEKDPQSIFQTNVDFAAGTATNGSPSATSSTNLFTPSLASLLDFSDVFALSNLPSLSGQPDSSHLLVLSQESGQIVNISRTGAVSSRLTLVADVDNPLSIADQTVEGVAMDRDGNLYVVNESGGGDASHPQLWVYAPSSAPNLPPTGIVLHNTVTSLPENSSTAGGVKMADIVVDDDGLGDNQLAVVGPDAAAFRIIGTSLFLRPGTPLSAAAKPSYSVTVTVNDPSVGGTPDASLPFLLTITASTGGTPTLLITEVAPWSSGNSPAALAADWFEVTNVGTASANISGWRMDDTGPAFTAAATLQGITTIAPGESVIFIETDNLAAKKPAFLSLWFGANPPPNLQVGNYSAPGVGLGTGGDAVNLFDTTQTIRASVTFGSSPGVPGPFPTFDNAAGLNGTTITTLSAVGVNGAFAAAGDALEIGSPGTIGAASTPEVTITSPDASASEAGGDTGTFRITRTGSTVGVMTVNYTIAGSVVSGDYTPALNGVATIPSGQASVDITIQPVDDSAFEGTETLTLTLFDAGSYDVGTPDEATMTIVDNDPPDTFIDSAPGGATNSTTAQLVFHAGAPLPAIARLECSLDGAAFVPCTSPRSYGSLADGSHTFAVRAVAASGLVDATPATMTWTVDTIAPTITCTATPDVLWPANNKLQAVSIGVQVADAGSGPAGFSLTSATSSEAASGDPDIQGFTPGTASTTGFLRASREGAGNGRTYALTYVASDRAGNTASCAAAVLVPHDEGK